MLDDFEAAATRQAVMAVDPDTKLMLARALMRTTEDPDLESIYRALALDLMVARRLENDAGVVLAAEVARMLGDGLA
jgi:hypothetical protein